MEDEGASSLWSAGVIPAGPGPGPAEPGEQVGGRF